MATPTEQTKHTATAVAGYFDDSADARRAITALTDAGFQTENIGAAFYSASTQTNLTQTGTMQTGTTNDSALGRDDVDVVEGMTGETDTSLPHAKLRDAESFGAVDSDDSAVQPNVIATGYGTGRSGAERPGPISGSSLAHSGLPSELKSTLPHDDTFQEHQGTTTGETRSTRDDEPGLSKESQNFGTGEGHLILGGKSRQVAYSHKGFERSFEGYGLSPDLARHVSHRLGRGGAVLTVHGTARNEEAARILEANGGSIQFADTDVAPEPMTEGNIEVYGTIDRDYTVTHE